MMPMTGEALDSPRGPVRCTRRTGTGGTPYAAVTVCKSCHRLVIVGNRPAAAPPGRSIEPAPVRKNRIQRLTPDRAGEQSEDGCCSARQPSFGRRAARPHSAAGAIQRQARRGGSVARRASSWFQNPRRLPGGFGSRGYRQENPQRFHRWSRDPPVSNVIRPTVDRLASVPDRVGRTE